MQIFVRDKYLILCCLIICIAYYLSFVDRAQVDVTIDVQKRTWFQIYWAEEGEPFSEKQQARVRVHPGKRSYSFPLTDLDGVARLRIDPQQYRGKSQISELILFQKGFAHVDLLAVMGQSAKIAGDTERWREKNGVFTTFSSGKDPQYIIMPQLKRVPFGWSGEIVRLLTIFSLLFAGGRLLSPLISRIRFVPFFLVGTLMIVLCMAMLSRQGVHPDEYVHLAAAEYYTDHWLPPAVESEEIRNTYSRYGNSRLNGREIYYLLAGKFKALLENFSLPGHLSLRLFNVSLFASLLVLAVRYQGIRIILAGFLITPQIWYVFSYCNSDAFALFLGALAGWQVTDRHSLFSKYTFTETLPPRSRVVAIIVLGLLLGSLLLVKKNYYPILLMLGLVYIQRLWTLREDIDFRSVCFKTALLILVASTLFGLRVGAELYVDGSDRSAKIANMRIEHAEPLFNLATPLHKRHVHLNMKERGVSLKKIIVQHRWFEKTFRSAFGVYGYFTVSATPALYDLFRWLAVSFLLFLTVSLGFEGDWTEKLLLSGAVLLSIGLVAASLNHSWTNDFQAQGRYLLPVVIMLAMPIALGKRAIHQQSLFLFCTILYSLSLYSFVHYGLTGLLA